MLSANKPKRTAAASRGFLATTRLSYNHCTIYGSITGVSRIVSADNRGFQVSTLFASPYRRSNISKIRIFKIFPGPFYLVYLVGQHYHSIGLASFLCMYVFCEKLLYLLILFLLLHKMHTYVILMFAYR